MKSLGKFLMFGAGALLWLWAGFEFGSEYGGVGTVLGFFIPLSGLILPGWLYAQTGLSIFTAIAAAIWLIGLAGFVIIRVIDKQNSFVKPR